MPHLRRVQGKMAHRCGPYRSFLNNPAALSDMRLPRTSRKRNRGAAAHSSDCDEQPKCHSVSEADQQLLTCFTHDRWAHLETENMSDREEPELSEQGESQAAEAPLIDSSNYVDEAMDDSQNFVSP